MTQFASLITRFSTPLLSAAIALSGTTSFAAPYCTDLLHKEALPAKYAKSAPIYSNAANGWIFTQDQLKDRYHMKDSAQHLVQAIVEEFAKRGVPLAIVVPPPRPIIAGQDTLDSTLQGRSYDVAAAQSSFDRLISGLASTGAIVPNLSAAAMMDAQTQANFYFRRDTHWTTTGAAVSAISLAQAVEAARPTLFANDAAFSPSDLIPSGEIEEKGSLAKLARAACEVTLPPETTTAFDLTRAGDLFATNAGSPTIALVGSSFSNRYKRDHYRFGEALARAFDADVENYSISGGGPIGAIEAYVLSGMLEQRKHALVVWELPYTENFNNTSFLHQLLGALKATNAAQTTPAAAYETTKTDTTATLKLTKGTDATGLQVQTADKAHQGFRLTLHYADGAKTKITLSRRTAVPAEMRSDSLFAALPLRNDQPPAQITITARKKARIARLSLF